MSEAPFIPDVFIAGSGPIGCTFARMLLDKGYKVLMAEMGSQDNPVIGAHHKNSVKYQKDIDAFVHVIQGALQPVSVPPESTYMSTLGEVAWTAAPGQKLTSSFYNPNQVKELNLPGCAITRTVGGMATHWTCACPEPHAEEREKSPIQPELPGLLAKAKEYLKVSEDQFNDSIRHNLVKNTLEQSYAGRIKNLPLAVQRDRKNKDLVTWSGSDTVLGKYAKGDANFKLLAEHKVVKLEVGADNLDDSGIQHVVVRDLNTHEEKQIQAKQYVIACGAVCTPQILWNSNIRPQALGRYLTEQSIAFCQVVLKKELIDKIETDPLYCNNARLKKFKQDFKDPIPIPFTDPEPQINMPYSHDTPWHVQIHRDAFSYGDVGPKADPRLIVDLRFFGKQDIEKDNYLTFEEKYTDIYGLPQATFNVKRSPRDVARDHKMMREMCDVANELGAFLPGSYPQFMPPGLALHITGTTRLGKNPMTSVANEFSQVHGITNLFVGGNNVIPDSTACNPTLTSMAYAIHACNHIIEALGGTPDEVPEPSSGPGNAQKQANGIDGGREPTPEPVADD